MNKGTLFWDLTFFTHSVENGGSKQTDRNGIRHKSNANVATASEAELPRLTGTKSQASTASSSATRDSGISVNDVQKAAEEALKSGQGLGNLRRQSKTGGSIKSRNGSSRSTISSSNNSING